MQHSCLRQVQGKAVLPTGKLLCNRLEKDLRKLQEDSSSKSVIPLKALDGVKTIWMAPGQQKTFSNS